LRVAAEEKLPQVLPVQLEPLADQVTPLLSLVAGVTESTWVTARAARAGETATEA
jgi:hypothetical protein